MSDMVLLCLDCGSAVVPKGSGKNWQGTNQYDDPCKFCGGATVYCNINDREAILKKENRGRGF